MLQINPYPKNKRASKLSPMIKTSEQRVQVACYWRPLENDLSFNLTIVQFNSIPP